jgi:hypothetical protein
MLAGLLALMVAALFTGAAVRTVLGAAATAVFLLAAA